MNIDPELISALEGTDFLSGYAVLLILQQSKQPDPGTKLALLQQAQILLARRANTLLPPAEETATEIGVTFEAAQISPQGRKYLWKALDRAVEEVDRKYRDHPGVSQDTPIEAETEQKPPKPQKVKPEILQRNCDHCQGEFVMKTSTQRFCSHRCQQQWHLDRREERKQAEGKTRKPASSDPPPTRECRNCSEPFPVTRQDRLYCSELCLNRFNGRVAYNKNRDKRKQQVNERRIRIKGQHKEIQRPASQDFLERAILSEPEEESVGFSGDGGPALNEVEEIEQVEEIEVEEIEPEPVATAPAALALRSKLPATGQPLLRAKDYLAAREKAKAQTEKKDPLVTFRCEACGNTYEDLPTHPEPHLCSPKCVRRWEEDHQPDYRGKTFKIREQYRKQR